MGVISHGSPAPPQLTAMSWPSPGAFGAISHGRPCASPGPWLSFPPSLTLASDHPAPSSPRMEHQRSAIKTSSTLIHTAMHQTGLQRLNLHSPQFYEFLNNLFWLYMRTNTFLCHQCERVCPNSDKCFIVQKQHNWHFYPSFLCSKGQTKANTESN